MHILLSAGDIDDLGSKGGGRGVNRDTGTVWCGEGVTVSVDGTESFLGVFSKCLLK